MMFILITSKIILKRVPAGMLARESLARFAQVEMVVVDLQCCELAFGLLNASWRSPLDCMSCPQFAFAGR